LLVYCQENKIWTQSEEGWTGNLRSKGSDEEKKRKKKKRKKLLGKGGWSEQVVGEMKRVRR